MTKAETLAKKRENDDDFQKDLSINKFKLDEECISHPSIYGYYAEAQAQAKVEVSYLKDALELVESEANLRIRQNFATAGQKVTEGVIACTLAQDKEVMDAKARLRDAEKLYGRLTVAVNALDVKRSELDNLVKLYCAGYFSAPSASGARENINGMTEKSIRKGLNKKE